MQPPPPVVVHVVETPVETTSVVDILLGALGLTGVLLLAAALLGAALGGILIGLKLLRARYSRESVPESEALRVTPGNTTP